MKLIESIACDITGLWKPECSCEECQRELIEKHAPHVALMLHGMQP